MNESSHAVLLRENDYVRVTKDEDIKAHIVRQYSRTIEDVENSYPGKHSAIKFASKLPNSHFIQFTTRQLVSHKSFDESTFTEQEMDPNEVKSLSAMNGNYMPDFQTVRWRVDHTVTTLSSYQLPKTPTLPYYDGVSDTSGNLAVLDEPDLEDPTERIVVVTYLISDNKVKCEIRWSRQFIVNEQAMQSDYCCELQDCKALPDWAIKAITQDLFGINHDFKTPFVYDLPMELRILADGKQTDAILQQQALTALLPPPLNWIAFTTYPNLMPMTMRASLGGSQRVPAVVEIHSQAQLLQSGQQLETSTGEFKDNVEDLFIQHDQPEEAPVHASSTYSQLRTVMPPAKLDQLRELSIDFNVHFDDEHEVAEASVSDENEESEDEAEAETATHSLKQDQEFEADPDFKFKM